MSTEDLVAEYLANGGKITKLPDGTAEGALDLSVMKAIGHNGSPKAVEGHEELYGTKEFN
jgi:hypothetical protein